ncbi:hypothetical protein D3C79_906850 [compost metagenome]
MAAQRALPSLLPAIISLPMPATLCTACTPATLRIWKSNDSTARITAGARQASSRPRVWTNTASTSRPMA